MANNIAEVCALLRLNLSPDDGILLDDGEYYIEEESETNGLLLQRCSLALQEEDDAECHGGYERRSDGIWVINFRTHDGNSAVDVSAEVDDKEQGIAILWIQRQSTLSYRTGSEEK